MTPKLSEPVQHRPAPHRDSARARSAQEERKQVYLRTLYALNPGLPHSVDFPTGWD